MLKLILLGAIQGLTEFLPVSSSGHLVIAQGLLGIRQNVIFLDTSLHLGTILALLSFFWGDIFRTLRDARTIQRILIVTAVTGLIGMTFKKYFVPLFDQSVLVCALLLINGLIILSTRFIKQGERKINNVDSALMGLAQGIAITPGISRSGATIAMLLFRKNNRSDVFRFSFLASIPAIIGAFVLEAKDADWSLITDYSPAGLAGGIAAAWITGLLALVILKKILYQGKFYLFGYYCIFAAILFLALSP